MATLPRIIVKINKVIIQKVMSKIPTEEQVKEHFKNAVVVRDNYGDTDDYREDEVRWNSASKAWCIPLTGRGGFDLVLWDETKGYAKIEILRKGGPIFTDTPSERFDNVINHTLDKLLDLLTVKGKEYRRNDNPFHNFDRGAEITGRTREEVLQGFLLKHLISVEDMRNDMKEGKFPTQEKVEEKYNDILVYFLIEKASVLERIKYSE